MKKIISKPRIKKVAKERGIENLSVSQSAVDKLEEYLILAISEIVFDASHWRGLNKKQRITDEHVKMALETLGFPDLSS